VSFYKYNFIDIKNTFKDQIAIKYSILEFFSKFKKYVFCGEILDPK